MGTPFRSLYPLWQPTEASQAAVHRGRTVNTLGPCFHVPVDLKVGLQPLHAAAPPGAFAVGQARGCTRANVRRDATHPARPPDCLGCSHGKRSSFCPRGQPPLLIFLPPPLGHPLKGSCPVASLQGQRAPSRDKSKQSFHGHAEVGTRNSKAVLCPCPNSALLSQVSTHLLHRHTPAQCPSACGFGITRFGTDLITLGQSSGGLVMMSPVSSDVPKLIASGRSCLHPRGA